ncbi:MAG: manganese-binding transcriptional regulator MntR [Alphaproteobacteria bacterium]|nr:manganese-binding transcriptional regulator MntR [Alphaproteobacteria bacterium]
MKRKISSSALRSAAFNRTRADHSHELAHDYCELIAELIDEKGEARGTDIALRMGVSNATVAKTLKRLSEQGLVEQEPYRAVFLTGEGWKLAEDGKRRHEIVEKFLLALGVSQRTAEVDSEGIEHHVSAETLKAMARFLARS